MEFGPIVDQLTDAVVVASADNTVLYANGALAELLGWSVDEIVGRPITTLMPARMRSRHERGFARYQDSVEPRMFGAPVQLVALCANGDEIDIDLTLTEVHVPPDAAEQTARGVVVVATFRDVGARVAMERRLSSARYLRATIEATSTLQTVDHPDEALASLLHSLCEQLDWDVGVVWKQDDSGRLTAIDVWHAPDTPSAAIDAMTRRLHLAPGEGLPGKVWATGGPRVVPDVSASAQFLRVDASREAGLTTGVGFPLVADEEVLGVIEFFSRRPRAVDDELTVTLAAIGRQLGSYLARVNSQAALRTLAETLQQALLPATLPAIRGLELAASYRPGAQDVSVGGDIYDVFRLGPDAWALLIADVCGKGPAAAAVTALTRHTVRATALDDPAPQHVVDSLNRALLDGGERPFLTAVYVVLHRDRGDGRAAPTWTAEIACAGHPLPALVHGESVELVGRPGTLVGVIADAPVHPVTVDLRPGETLVLYTDGVTEARGGDREMFGSVRLTEALAGTGGSASEAVRALDHAVGRHHAGAGAGDDVAILAVAVPL